MKNKGSASLYEVLKSASRPQGDGAPAPSPETTQAPSTGTGQPTLQERLAAYKAAKLALAAPGAFAPAASAPAVAEATPPPVEPASAAAALTPMPAPAPAGRRAEAKPSPGVAGPGERVFKVTYNTAVFATLVGVGLLFIAYALGAKAGRARAESAVEANVPAVPAPDVTPPRPAPPKTPPVRKEYTIRLAEWRTVTTKENVEADLLAEDLKKVLEKNNFKGAEKVKIVRGGEPRLAFYFGKFSDVTTDAAKSKLAALQKFKVAVRGQAQTPFAKAEFEEISIPR